jgi:hypothetical protein
VLLHGLIRCCGTPLTQIQPDAVSAACKVFFKVGPFWYEAVGPFCLCYITQPCVSFLTCLPVAAAVAGCRRLCPWPLQQQQQQLLPSWHLCCSEAYRNTFLQHLRSRRSTDHQRRQERMQPLHREELCGGLGGDDMQKLPEAVRWLRAVCQL